MAAKQPREVKFSHGLYRNPIQYSINSTNPTMTTKTAARNFGIDDDPKKGRNTNRCANAAYELPKDHLPRKRNRSHSPAGRASLDRDKPRQYTSKWDERWRRHRSSSPNVKSSSDRNQSRNHSSRDSLRSRKDSKLDERGRSKGDARLTSKETRQGGSLHGSTFESISSERRHADREEKYDLKPRDRYTERSEDRCKRRGGDGRESRKRGRSLSNSCRDDNNNAEKSKISHPPPPSTIERPKALKIQYEVGVSAQEIVKRMDRESRFDGAQEQRDKKKYSQEIINRKAKVVNRVRLMCRKYF
jgi:hypothetical protein